MLGSQCPAYGRNADPCRLTQGASPEGVTPSHTPGACAIVCEPRTLARCPANLSGGCGKGWPRWDCPFLFVKRSGIRN